MPDLVERCSKQLSGECGDCRFDSLNTKRDSQGREILYSVRNSQCDNGYEPQIITITIA